MFAIVVHLGGCGQSTSSFSDVSYYHDNSNHHYDKDTHIAYYSTGHSDLHY